MESKHKLGKRTILIAYENALIRKSLCEWAQSADPEAFILEAANGEDAVETALVEGPYIVLVDIDMPRMNGIEATMSIKVVLPCTKVIIVTAHDDNVFRLVAQKAGASAYILKREVGDNLALTLREILYEKAGAGAEQNNLYDYFKQASHHTPLLDGKM